MAKIPEIRNIDPELNEMLMKDFKGHREGFVQVGQEKWFLPKQFEEVAADILNVKVRPDDTWLVALPRTGTTLTSELMWLIKNKLDFETAKNIPVVARFQLLEVSALLHKDVLNEIRSENSVEEGKLLDYATNPSWVTINTAPSPRFIKTHLPIQLLPKNLLTSGAKVFYVARNPKDVAVSRYYLSKLGRFSHFLGDFEKFWNYFEKNLVIWSPFWDHVIEGWNNRHNPNVQFLFYEEFIKNPSDYISKVAKFLNKKLTEEEVNKLLKHVEFDNFKKNPSVNLEKMFTVNGMTTPERNFIRKGKVGDWIDEFTPELSAKADKWIEENLKKTDLRFPL